MLGKENQAYDEDMCAQRICKFSSMHRVLDVCSFPTKSLVHCLDGFFIVRVV